MTETLMCRSCGERPAESGPLCARCSDLKMGLAVPTDEEAARLGLAVPMMIPETQAGRQPARQFDLGGPEPESPPYVQLARSASRAGRQYFQAVFPLTDTQRTIGGIVGGSKAMKTWVADQIPEALEAIEKEGWRLEHASFVFQETGSVSRDKFFSSGQVEAVTGSIIGIYLFRAAEWAEPHSGDPAS